MEKVGYYIAIEARRRRRWRRRWRRRLYLLVGTINFLCMSLITSSRTISIMAEIFFKWPIYSDFSHFTSIILPCGRV